MKCYFRRSGGILWFDITNDEGDHGETLLVSVVPGGGTELEDFLKKIDELFSLQLTAEKMIFIRDPVRVAEELLSQEERSPGPHIIDKIDRGGGWWNAECRCGWGKDPLNEMPSECTLFDSEEEADRQAEWHTSRYSDEAIAEARALVEESTTLTDADIPF